MNAPRTYVRLCIYIMCNENILITIGEVYKKCKLQSRLWCYYFWHIFRKLTNNVMYACTNKQYGTFQNCISILSRLCQGKG